MEELEDAWRSAIRSLDAHLSSTEISGAWLSRLQEIDARVRELAEQDTDAALYFLVQIASNETGDYSASHAAFCAVVADLCVKHLELPEEEAQALHFSALTMNVSMTAVQDQMAKQSSGLSTEQRLIIERHASRSAELLAASGEVSELCLEIIKRHHTPAAPAQAESWTVVERLATLLHRIDVYTAKLSRRTSRPGISPSMAARETCLDASGRPDRFGSAILTSMGLYPPGSLVQLASGEIAVVVQRGHKAHEPVVATVMRPTGALITLPQIALTSDTGSAVRRSLAGSDARIRIHHGRAWSALARWRAGAGV